MPKLKSGKRSIGRSIKKSGKRFAKSDAYSNLKSVGSSIGSSLLSLGEYAGRNILDKQLGNVYNKVDEMVRAPPQQRTYTQPPSDNSPPRANGAFARGRDDEEYDIDYYDDDDYDDDYYEADDGNDFYGSGIEKRRKRRKNLKKKKANDEICH